MERIGIEPMTSALQTRRDRLRPFAPVRQTGMVERNPLFSRNVSVPRLANAAYTARLFTLFRADANYCATAATREQATAMTGHDPSGDRRSAVRDGSAEDQQAKQRQQQEARKRHENEWGYAPPEFT